MELGMIGLGRMGANMARRLMARGHQCAVYNRTPGPVAELAKAGAIGATSLKDLVGRLKAPRTLWIMVPVAAVEGVVTELAPLLQRGDCIIDGGNSPFENAIRRAGELAPRGVDYLDVGTSGGVWGLERGYCLMIGGPDPAVKRLDPIFRDLAPGRGSVAVTPGLESHRSAADGYLHCGPAGAGHFVKMVHNGIEYGIMAAYAEGFNLFSHAGAGRAPGASPENAERYQYAFDLPAIAELWRRGSVVSSWLLDLTAAALAGDPKLGGFHGKVSDSGEGRWTLKAAIDTAVPVPVLSAALYSRFDSRGESDFANRVLSAMRFQFGGHREPGGDSTKK
jgi:6-phosphogluconate dehydrogenase